MDQQSRVRRFEETVMAHLDAAYDFARWLTRDERNAEDVVQEACLRAFRFLDGQQPSGFHQQCAHLVVLPYRRYDGRLRLAGA